MSEIEKKEIEKKNSELEKGFEAKAEEMSLTLKTKITANWVKHNDEYVVGYMQEPDRFTKMQAMDMMVKSLTQASDIVLRASLIHKESDSRILDEAADDKIYLGFIMKAQESVQFYGVQSKKN